MFTVGIDRSAHNGKNISVEWWQEVVVVDNFSFQNVYVPVQGLQEASMISCSNCCTLFHHIK